MGRKIRKTKSILILIQILISTFVYTQIEGCTDILAENYDASATLNDGSCVYSNTIIEADWGILLPEVMNGTSGLLTSNDLLITHNDHSDDALYFFSPENPNEHTIANTNHYFKDWEEIDEDKDYYYLGDFGNNSSGNRTSLRIYRIKKDSVFNHPIADTIHFSYENQTNFDSQPQNSTDFDCEAFVVTDEKIYLFTKEWLSKKTSVYEIPKTPGNHTAILKDSYDVNGLITGATLLKEKQLLVLSGYSTFLQPFVLLLYDFWGNNFFSGNKRKIEINLPYHQVEGIATNDGLNYYITNEKFEFGEYNYPAKLHLLNLTEFLENYLNGGTINDLNTQYSSYKIYPNPVKRGHHIYIQTKENNTPFIFEIRDLSGRIIQTQQYEYPTNQYYLPENIAKGIYHICFISKQQQVFTTKLIVE